MSWSEDGKRFDSWSKRMWGLEIDTATVVKVTSKALIDGSGFGYHYPDLGSALWPSEPVPRNTLFEPDGPPHQTLNKALDTLLFDAITWGEGAEYGKGPKYLTPNEIKMLTEIWRGYF